jgi:hypothetical protein
MRVDELCAARQSLPGQKKIPLHLGTGMVRLTVISYRYSKDAATKTAVTIFDIVFPGGEFP